MVYNPRKTKINIGEEENYASQAASMEEYWGIFQPVTRDDDYDLNERDGIRDSIESGGFDKMVQRHAFDMPLDWVNNWRHLFYVFGSHEEVEDDGVYTHTLTPLNESYHPSFTAEVVEKAGTNDVSRYLGTVVEEWSLDWSVGEQITSTLSVIARDVLPDTAEAGNSAEPSGALYYNFSHVKLEVDSTTVKHENGSLTLNKNVEAEPRVDAGDGDIKIKRPYTGKFEWTLTFSRKKDDRTIRTAWKTGDKVPVKLHVVRNAANDNLEIDLGMCTIKQVQTPIDTGNDTNREDITIQPEKNIQAVVQDLTSWGYDDWD